MVRSVISSVSSPVTWASMTGTTFAKGSSGLPLLRYRRSRPDTRDKSLLPTTMSRSPSPFRSTAPRSCDSYSSVEMSSPGPKLTVPVTGNWFRYSRFLDVCEGSFARKFATARSRYPSPLKSASTPPFERSASALTSVAAERFKTPGVELFRKKRFTPELRSKAAFTTTISGLPLLFRSPIRICVVRSVVGPKSNPAAKPTGTDPAANWLR